MERPAESETIADSRIGEGRTKVDHKESGWGWQSETRRKGDARPEPLPDCNWCPLDWVSPYQRS